MLAAHPFGKRRSASFERPASAARVAESNTANGNKPKAKPWYFIILLYFLAFFLPVGEMHRDWHPPYWTIPAENELTYTSGQFSTVRFDERNPYIFRASDGTRIELGCKPEGAVATCIGDSGIDLRQLSANPTTIGYFEVYDPLSPRLDNVLMTMTVNQRAVFSYANRKREFEQWAVQEDKMNHSFDTILRDVLLPLSVFLPLAIAFTLQKLKAKREEEQ